MVDAKNHIQSDSRSNVVFKRHVSGVSIKLYFCMCQQFSQVPQRMLSQGRLLKIVIFFSQVCQAFPNFSTSMIPSFLVARKKFRGLQPRDDLPSSSEAVNIQTG